MTVAAQEYQQLAAQADAEIASLEGTDRRYAVVRGGLFLAALVCGVVALTRAEIRWLLAVAAAFLVAFFVAVVMNEAVRIRMRAARDGRWALQRLLARVNQDWSALANQLSAGKVDTGSIDPHRRAVSADLDLLGHASLFEFVSMASTTVGIRTLADWLTGPAIADVAAERHAAIKTLAPVRSRRLRFYTLAREVGGTSGDADQFVRWAKGPAWLSKRRWLSVWARASSVVAIISVLIVASHLIGGLFLADSADAGSVWLGLVRVAILALIGLVIINVAITTIVLGPAHSIFAQTIGNRVAIESYDELFAAANWLPESDAETGSSSLLDRIRHQLTDGDRAATRAMHDLRAVARRSALRNDPRTVLLVYLPLQGLALWDVHVLSRLERWQAKYADVTEEWFGALGELEALMSLAAVSDEQPDWVSPRWTLTSGQPGGEVAIKSRRLGHPLLSSDVRVPNDVTLGPTGRVLLVTGSNMSGKSTMLRSVGLNVQLAAAGAPVCAAEFSLPSCELATSIRVSDDVSRGVSYYMAELHRLKEVVDHADQLSGRDDRVSVYLLDEILQGTNSRERQIAVVRVLRHLVDAGAIGAITTHDLELADESELIRVAETVHFRETIRPDADGNDRMTFDYQMHPGVSPTTNALRLLEMVGIQDPNDGE